MDFKTVYFNDVGKEQWDNWVADIKTTSYHHSWSWIDHASKFQNVMENRSFVCLDSDFSPLAICPLIVTSSKGFNEISVNGGPVGVPALADKFNPSIRRKLLDAVFCVIQDCVKANDVKKMIMTTHPLTRSVCADEISGFRNAFELLRYQMLCRVTNTLVIDLGLSDEILFLNVGKYQRRHITRGRKKKIETKAFNGSENTEQLKHWFYKYQDAHFAAAGRMTRPQETWDTMYDIALNGEASLFCAFLEDTAISFLFCGEFSSMAFGWSQVNVKEFEKAYSPRHLLEWEAMNYYKRNGFRYYEVGERFYGPQLLYVPTDKEITIGEFKERYGGFLLPKITWLGYYDRELLNSDLKVCLEGYYLNDNLIKVPQVNE